ncbi:T9SS type A sorting domain-containing protein [Hymenobacter sp. PAMC 26628]|uniref:T9SS type A sorting domain-containing protein n=1 Tax=Hymenobacter sp. PAMC 26628 TaxID=1484118 RepID=UPI000ABCA0BF|nr:T9SS type A sorting domain-containing protein [Hymenobacter sp. PAMC 26628]
MIRLLRLLPALLLLALAARAQSVLPVQPLPADPSRAAPARGPVVARRGTALGLPFFDDFTTPREGNPRVQNWLPGGGALVNNRLPVHPLTRGVATLDGLRANGQGYGNTPNFGAIDSLTSQPIDLSGYGPGNGVFLTFAWQEGSVVGPSERSSGSTPVALELFFLDRDGRWVSQWKQLAGGAAVSGFRQKAVAVADARYFHAGFQFQFQATGNVSVSTDAWSLDYFVLGANRTAADTTYADLATAQGLGNPLRRYTALPWWQYNAAAPASELNPMLNAEITNLNPGPIPTPISWTGTVQDVAGGFQGTWLTDSRSIPTQPRQTVIGGSARTAPLPTTSAAKQLRYTLALNTRVAAGDRTLPNDTLSRDVFLNDYYAFDDGTAEAVLALPATSTGPIQYLAYALDLNQPDQVKGVRLYPVFLNNAQGDNGANRSVTIGVWADDKGQPAATPLMTQTATLRNPLTNPSAAGQPFVDVLFSASVPVSGRVYVGYGQTARGQFLPYGIDLNNPPPANTLWRTNQGTWLAFSALPAGAPMLRPLLTNNQTVITATTPPAAAGAPAVFSLYPNPLPTGGTIAVAGPAFARASLLDALGRTIWEQPAAEAGRPQLTPGRLAAGVYLVRLHLANGSTVTRRLVVSE